MEQADGYLPSKFMKKLDDAVKQYLAEMASKGGKARAAKYDKKTLSQWAKKGGRPPKKGKAK
jgi:general stress protein YciG